MRRLLLALATVLAGLGLTFLVSWRDWRAFAQSSPAPAVTVTWSAPTQNVDGTPIVGLASYEVQWFGATVEPWSAYNADEVPVSVTSYSVPLICGSYSIQVRADTVDPVTGAINSSDWTAPVTYATSVPCPPNVIDALLQVQ